jgi:hypothetical protein
MNTKGEKGFITTLLIIIIALAALKYFFNWSIFDAAASEEGRGTISYIRDVLNRVWSLVETPVEFAWNEVVRPLFSFAFDSLRALMDSGKEAASGQ